MCISPEPSGTQARRRGPAPSRKEQSTIIALYRALFRSQRVGPFLPPDNRHRPTREPRLEAPPVEVLDLH